MGMLFLPKTVVLFLIVYLSLCTFHCLTKDMSWFAKFYLNLQNCLPHLTHFLLSLSVFLFSVFPSTGEVTSDYWKRFISASFLYNIYAIDFCYILQVMFYELPCSHTQVLLALFENASDLNVHVIFQAAHSYRRLRMEVCRQLVVEVCTWRKRIAPHTSTLTLDAGRVTCESPSVVSTFFFPRIIRL